MYCIFNFLGWIINTSCVKLLIRLSLCRMIAIPVSSDAIKLSNDEFVWGVLDRECLISGGRRSLLLSFFWPRTKRAPGNWQVVNVILHAMLMECKANGSWCFCPVAAARREQSTKRKGHAWESLPCTDNKVRSHKRYTVYIHLGVPLFYECVCVCPKLVFYTLSSFRRSEGKPTAAFMLKSNLHL